MKDCSIEAVPMDGQEKRIREGEQREATEVRIVLHTRLHGQTKSLKRIAGLLLSFTFSALIVDAFQ